jgi:hypothetical protein
MQLPSLAAAVFSSLLAAAMPMDGVAWAEDAPAECPKNQPKAPEIARADVYKGMPFKSGEEATYELSWGGMKAGYGTLAVKPPRKHADVWHRVYHVDASTGDWFKAVFVAKEEMEALTRPWDFAVSKFYMSQNEGKIFSKPFVQKKWLEFDHTNCKVNERIEEPGKDEKKKTFDLAFGAMDALGVIYQLRTREYKIGEKQRALVYTSEKNWWLEAEPVAMEKVTVPAGTFDAVKLRLHTFIGKELQQKGEVYAWIATKTPEKQLVQLQGEIKIGSVWVKLHKYKAGT